MSHWRYAKYLARHKWFVFVAGLRLHVPLWRLIIHDWSKLMPCEWVPYARSFYGGPWPTLQEASVQCPGYSGPTKQSVRLAFDAAWLHHQHFNPHHWQHWVLREDSGDTKLLEMPENFVREMVADWCGAGRAITGKWDVGSWYRRNAERIQTNPATTLRVLTLISEWERRVTPSATTSGAASAKGESE